MKKIIKTEKKKMLLADGRVPWNFRSKLRF